VNRHSTASRTQVLTTPTHCSGYVGVTYELVCVRIGVGTASLDTTFRNESYDEPTQQSMSLTCHFWRTCHSYNSAHTRTGCVTGLYTPLTITVVCSPAYGLTNGHTTSVIWSSSPCVRLHQTAAKLQSPTTV